MSGASIGRPAPPALTIAIIGLGPRGLGVLERVVLHCASRPKLPVQVVVFEPGRPGCGSHSPSQPDYLRLNTIAAQLSMFPGALPNSPAQAHYGPSLFEWCVARGLMVPDSYGSGNSAHRTPRPTDFLPRRFLGKYLDWFYRYLTSIAPAHVTISWRQAVAEDIRWDPGSGRFSIDCDAGGCVAAHCCFVTIGHAMQRPTATGETNASPRFAYPLPTSVLNAGDGRCVRIQGMGLTAMDVMVALIDQWGGRFTLAPDLSMQYQRSGREGVLIFESRFARPYCARPVTSPERRPRAARFLCAREIDRRPAEQGETEYGFVEMVLPLMRLEMLTAYYACCASLRAGGIDAAAAERVEAMVQQAALDGDPATILARLAEEYGRFDPNEHIALRPPPSSTAKAHLQWFLEYQARDLRESYRGLSHSPLKASLEVWRDLRDALRAVLEDPRLSSRGRSEFYQFYAPMINRLVAGPQWERVAEFQCLLKAGIARLSCGFNASEQVSGDAAAQLVREPKLTLRAFVAPSDVNRTDSPLLHNMADAGLVSMLSDVGVNGCIRITAEGNAICPQGKPNERLWIFGSCTEGATYYNHYVPSPGRPSRSYLDADRAVTRCLRLAVGTQQAQR